MRFPVLLGFQIGGVKNTSRCVGVEEGPSRVCFSISLGRLWGFLSYEKQGFPNSWSFPGRAMP